MKNKKIASQNENYQIKEKKETAKYIETLIKRKTNPNKYDNYTIKNGIKRLMKIVSDHNEKRTFYNPISSSDSSKILQSRSNANRSRISSRFRESQTSLYSNLNTKNQNYELKY